MKKSKNIETYIISFDSVKSLLKIHMEREKNFIITLMDDKQYCNVYNSNSQNGWDVEQLLNQMTSRKVMFVSFPDKKYSISVEYIGLDEKYKTCVYYEKQI